MTPLPRRAVPAAVILALSLLVGCGGGDDGGDRAAPPSSDAAPGSTGGGGGGGDGGPAVPTGGAPIADVDTSAAGVAAPEELARALTVIGWDTPGYVAGTTIVLREDPADATSGQFLCIASGQLELTTYEIVVVDADGEPLDCL